MNEPKTPFGDFGTPEVARVEGITSRRTARAEKQQFRRVLHAGSRAPGRYFFVTILAQTKPVGAETEDDLIRPLERGEDYESPAVV